jgi:hypothetical protein
MNWYTIIMGMLPLISGFLVIKGLTFYGETKHSPKSISPSYFAAVALLFALFASLIFSEVWNRVGKINGLMLEEANSLRAILRITENDPAIASRYQTAIHNYMESIEKKELRMSKNTEAGVNSNKLFNPLYVLATDSVTFRNKSNVQMALLNKTDQLRNAWFEREELLKYRIVPEKLLILFLMGFFTQISIAMSHLGNKKAIRDTVLVFSLAFFSAIAILLFIDDTELSRQFLSIQVLKDVH